MKTNSVFIESKDMEAWKKSMAKEKRKLIKEDGKVDSTKIMP